MFQHPALETGPGWAGGALGWGHAAVDTACGREWSGLHGSPVNLLCDLRTVTIPP